MTTPSFVLATDLDGTFLGGSDAQRAALYQEIERKRGDWLLIFVTGRDLGFIDQLCDEPGMPRPDYVVGDVGTTVVHGHSFDPLPEVQDWVSEIWGGRGDEVRAMLADEPGLTLQPTPFERRVSYYYEPDKLRPETAEKVRAAGFDVITSAEMYFDVMPKGVSKGPTLLRTIEVLKLPKETVLVAGDTLNDLSLFETGLDGVAVGNSEPKLVERVRDMPNVYLSPQPGAAGIHDAIRHLGKG